MKKIGAFIAYIVILIESYRMGKFFERTLKKYGI